MFKFKGETIVSFLLSYWKLISHKVRKNIFQKFFFKIFNHKIQEHITEKSKSSSWFSNNFKHFIYQMPFIFSFNRLPSWYNLIKSIYYEILRQKWWHCSEMTFFLNAGLNIFKSFVSEFFFVLNCLYFFRCLLFLTLNSQRGSHYFLLH